MALVMPKESAGGNYEIQPEGNHLCCCCAVIDLGTQQVQYENQPLKQQRKIFISWEICGEKKSNGEPFYIGKRYTYSSSEKSNLRRDLESWRGKKFTAEELGSFLVKNLLGKHCMLNIVHSERDGSNYANIASVAAMPKGMKGPALTEDPVYFSLEDDEFDLSAMEGLSEKLQDTIKQSPEFQNRVTGKPKQDRIAAEYAGDDIPF